jgi:hypothetical protein
VLTIAFVGGLYYWKHKHFIQTQQEHTKKPLFQEPEPDLEREVDFAPLPMISASVVILVDLSSIPDAHTSPIMSSSTPYPAIATTACTNQPMTDSRALSSYEAKREQQRLTMATNPNTIHPVPAYKDQVHSVLHPTRMQ